MTPFKKVQGAAKATQVASGMLPLHGPGHKESRHTVISHKSAGFGFIPLAHEYDCFSSAVLSLKTALYTDCFPHSM